MTVVVVAMVVVMMAMAVVVVGARRSGNSEVLERQALVPVVDVVLVFLQRSTSPGPGAVSS